MSLNKSKNPKENGIRSELPKWGGHSRSYQPPEMASPSRAWTDAVVKACKKKEKTEDLSSFWILCGNYMALSCVDVFIQLATKFSKAQYGFRQG